MSGESGSAPTARAEFEIPPSYCEHGVAVYMYRCPKCARQAAEMAVFERLNETLDRLADAITHLTAPGTGATSGSSKEAE